MRKSFTTFSLLLSCLLSIAAYADTTIVSKADALTIAKRAVLYKVRAHSNSPSTDG